MTNSQENGHDRLDPDSVSQDGARGCPDPHSIPGSPELRAGGKGSTGELQQGDSDGRRAELAHLRSEIEEDDCPRTLAFYKPGKPFPGLKCEYKWAGSSPCTGVLRCFRCDRERPATASEIAEKIGLTPRVRERLSAIQDAIERLHEWENEILDGIYARAKDLPLEALEKVVKLFPRGFHKAELYAWINQLRVDTARK